MTECCTGLGNICDTVVFGGVRKNEATLVKEKQNIPVLMSMLVRVVPLISLLRLVTKCIRIPKFFKDFH